MADAKRQSTEPAKVIGLQERRLGRTVLRTYRSQTDIDNVVPNEKQPRLGPKLDDELQLQIEANEGVFEPLLVEPHPDIPDKFRIIDGDRRWTNSQALVEAGREQFRTIPIEVTDRTLSDDERLRVWIYIHRQRKEWDTREKEMVAYRLIELMGRASAANILGISVRELDKLADVFELSERFENLRDPSAAITWSREVMGLSKKLVTPSVIDAIVTKVNRKQITNSKELRKLRTILRDPVASAHFLQDEGSIDSAMLEVAEAKPIRKTGFSSDLDVAVKSMQALPWTELEKLKGDPDTLAKIEEAEKLLASLKQNLSK
ncbi:ParB N-terminal domain-containing protein [uncultured Tateyamaria sp.]|uniref:ParB/RepB/Spo0J family partition protein n=1 Tax=uncultured Tateyamaria sp. TaxID=455651 RepID=UPI00261B8373|nr:ParB N-terminal domain-containing protein [uncultured Tateyamaria sp.]